jgi:hypothetical protein
MADINNNVRTPADVLAGVLLVKMYGKKRTDPSVSIPVVQMPTK